ncbi:MAG: O-linked N-acetylglucosamine transferase, SPINDLY family protein [Cyanobacteria bacterium RU_5_0]|nr:O-linked N-acetylglucosamine transferase, SPINDLY family protein [Cyanobacteria bacterium RU_5_0]
MNRVEWPLQIDRLFAQEQYVEATEQLASLIEHDPSEVTNYWYLGLAQWLQGEEAEAQMTWMTPLLEADPAQAEQLQAQLLQFWVQQGDRLNQTGRTGAAARLGELCLDLAPNDPKTLIAVITWMQHTGDADYLLKSIPLAQHCLTQPIDRVEQILCTHMILSASMSVCQNWQDSWAYYQIHKQGLTNLGLAPTSTLTAKERQSLPNLMGMGAFLLYFEDNPSVNRPIRNHLGSACHAELQQQSVQLGKQYIHNIHTHKSVRDSVQPLRIGYFSECLRQHSIGWLIRWLLKYHDRDRFEVHLYSLSDSEDAIQKSLKREYGDRFHSVKLPVCEIADQIHRDRIDILVELDSLTSLAGCGLVALKPAPIQVNWLGFDAAGIPGVDYFIADPYVLPDEASIYYQEKIWRLPQTYIAVDGFEIGIPNLRRDRLNIPNEAIVYFSSQSGLKRNPDNIRLQLKILNAVPNSYFLIKSQRSNPELLEAFFGQLADEAGVSRDRLRFLPHAPSELIHRANLRIADVVLDTYPYNGATTTLEALWMGLPIVTRVGEQFAARNSYTMLMNVGVKEGIAWTDDDYVAWGIRFGEDVALRSHIAAQLWRSQSTAALWKGQTFTHEMEKAYEQMWQLRQ